MDRESLRNMLKARKTRFARSHGLSAKSSKVWGDPTKSKFSVFSFVFLLFLLRELHGIYIGFWWILSENPVNSSKDIDRMRVRRATGPVIECLHVLKQA